MGVSLVPEYYEWEVELASLWPDDHALESKLLNEFVSRGHRYLKKHLDYMESLTEMYATGKRLGIRGALLPKALVT